MGFFKRLFGGNSTNDERPTDLKSLALAAGIDPKATVQIVRAYLVAVDPEYVIGIQYDDEWYLPGGIVEGPGRPEGMPPGQHYEPLAWHLREQTGLALEGLSGSVGVAVFPADGGMDVTVLYVGRASGNQTGGSRFPLDSIPDFAKICGVDTDQIRDLCGRL